MVIISVSSSKEKAMLNTVSVLRRLLRNAFLVTNRVNVIGELQSEPGTRHSGQECPSPPRIDEGVPDRQPVQIRFVPCSASRSRTLFAFHTYARCPRPQVEIVIRVG